MSEVPIRYMGNKRALAADLAAIIRSQAGGGRVADLFAGMGMVASRLAPSNPVLLNDAMAFACCVARSRFTAGLAKSDQASIIDDLRMPFRQAEGLLRRRFGRRLAIETRALDGGPEQLAAYMSHSPHVGRSDWYRYCGNRACSRVGWEHYQMLTLYFSGSYFGTSQAIKLDALRYAIDRLRSRERRDLALAIWLRSAAQVINAPGHTAQFLRPTTESAFRRICRQWSRDVWTIFDANLTNYEAVGSEEWRASNFVAHSDALELLERKRLPPDVSVVYADPPYTSDQYSRYYHVYETMLKYDFPSSNGMGRYPADRFSTEFSHKSGVMRAFRRLACGVASNGATLVLSYPEHGLLTRQGYDLRRIVGESFGSVETKAFVHNHSTLGGAHGEDSVEVVEQVVVARN